MLLPHEIVGALVRQQQPGTLFETQSMDPQTKADLDGAATRCQIDATRPLLGMSLWVDDVACKWDRNKSYEIYSLALPGLP